NTIARDMIVSSQVRTSIHGSAGAAWTSAASSEVPFARQDLEAWLERYNLMSAWQNLPDHQKNTLGAKEAYGCHERIERAFQSLFHGVAGNRCGRSEAFWPERKSASAQELDRRPRSPEHDGPAGDQ